MTTVPCLLLAEGTLEIIPPAWMEANNDAECIFIGNSSLDEDDTTLLREGKNLKNELQVLPRR